MESNNDIFRFLFKPGFSLGFMGGLLAIIANYFIRGPIEFQRRSLFQLILYPIAGGIVAQIFFLAKSVQWDMFQSLFVGATWVLFMSGFFSLAKAIIRGVDSFSDHDHDSKEGRKGNQ